MEEKIAIKTERLILRQWREEDLEPFAAINADPRVMEYFPATLSRAESDQLVREIVATFLFKGLCRRRGLPWRRRRDRG
jgi:RimJ/RimL family protein N-acetyltransferase